MASVNVTNIEVLDNPTTFLAPFRFQITFETVRQVPDDLEWRLVYVGSANSEEYDQLLDSVLVGPVPMGVNRFVFEAPPPDPSKIPQDDLLGVTVCLLIALYKGNEFIRVGYYVSNELPESEHENQHDHENGSEAAKQNGKQVGGPISSMNDKMKASSMQSQEQGQDTSSSSSSSSSSATSPSNSNSPLRNDNQNNQGNTQSMGKVGKQRGGQNGRNDDEMDIELSEGDDEDDDDEEEDGEENGDDGEENGDDDDDDDDDDNDDEQGEGGEEEGDENSENSENRGVQDDGVQGDENGKAHGKSNYKSGQQGKEQVQNGSRQVDKLGEPDQDGKDKSGKPVTHNATENHQPDKPISVSETDISKIRRVILADKPRVTRFFIDWDSGLNESNADSSEDPTAVEMED